MREKGKSASAIGAGLRDQQKHHSCSRTRRFSMRQSALTGCGVSNVKS